MNQMKKSKHENIKINIGDIFECWLFRLTKHRLFILVLEVPSEPRSPEKFYYICIGSYGRIIHNETHFSDFTNFELIQKPTRKLKKGFQKFKKECEEKGII